MELISSDIENYCREHTSPEPDVLHRLERETHLTQVYPRMLSGHLQGTLLRLISQMIRPARILEIGTFTGYSAICLAQGLAEGGILHTIEVDPELQWIIDKYVAEAGLSEKIRLHIGPAAQIIPELNETWDLVFIDADKPSYLDYYNLAMRSLRKGGIILADNALWDGKVLDPAAANKDARGIIDFNDFVQKDERVENFLAPLRDGLMMIRKKV